MRPIAGNRVELAELGADRLGRKQPAAEHHGGDDRGNNHHSEQRRQRDQRLVRHDPGARHHVGGVECGRAVEVHALRQRAAQGAPERARREPQAGNRRGQHHKGDKLPRSGNVPFLARLFKALR
jgi:hypothetical protein